MSDEPLFEVVPREDTRSAIGRAAPRRWRQVLLLAPAASLVGLVLLLPLLVTVAVSVAGGADVMRDDSAGPAFRNSLGWLAFAPVVCLAGLALAQLGRHARRSRPLIIGVLAAPAAVSALVSGIAFRLIFDPRPERGTVNAMLDVGTGADLPFLGSGWIWVVLASAFGWQWIGLAVVVFRAGLGEIPHDLLRVARAFGAGRIRRLSSVVVPALLPLGALVLVIVLVGAARVFELVLITAPGSIQDQVDVVGLQWWRSGNDLGDSGTAVLLFLFVGAAALVGLWGLSREWPGVRPEPAPPEPARSAARRWTVRVLGTLAILFWVMPLLVLLLTSVHTPRAAANGGWWRGGFGLDSYRQAFESGELLNALVNTGGRALAAAALLLVVAVPAAYALAWGGMSRVTVRVLIGIAAVLAVVPPQTVIVALGGVFDRLRLLGAPTALIVVHAALGVPLAVLLLRNAFALVPREEVRAPQLQPQPTSALFVIAVRSWPAVLTVAVLEFVLVWNDFVVGLLLGGPEAGQIMLVLYEQSRQFATSSGVLAAGAVVSVAIPLALVLATGKWLVRGLTKGVTR